MHGDNKRRWTGLFIGLLLCLPFQTSYAAPGTLVVTRAYEQSGFGVLCIDASDSEGNPLALSQETLSMTIGQSPARVVSLDTLRDANVPIATLLLLDTTQPLSRTQKTQLKEAVAGWIKGMRPDDMTAIVTCGGEATMKAGFVSNQQLLSITAEGIEYGVNGDTLLYDGLRVASETIVQRAAVLPPRVCVIAFTDGVDDSSTKTTAEEALALLGMQGASLYVIGMGDASEAVQALAPQSILQADTTGKAINDAFAAMHDRLLDSYVLRFILGDRPAEEPNYVMRLEAKDTAGQMIAEGQVMLRAPGDQATQGTADLLSVAQQLTPETPTPTWQATFIATAMAETAQPSPPSPSSPAPSPPSPTGGIAATSPALPGLLAQGHSLWQSATAAQRSLVVAGGIAVLGLIPITMYLTCRRVGKRRRKQAIARMVAAEQRLSPPPPETAGPPVQTNVAVRPPMYHPVTAAPFTHTRQLRPAEGEGTTETLQVTFRIIGPTGAVENKMLPVANGFTIGRDFACSLYVKDMSLSKKPITLVIQADGDLCLCDVKPGVVLVNGMKARGDWPLKSGATLRMGRTSVMVQYPPRTGHQ